MRVVTGHQRAVVEVYSQRGPVARGLSPSAFELEPGRYVVQARLPSGEQLQRSVEVAPGAAADEVDLLGGQPPQRTTRRRRRIAASRATARRARRAARAGGRARARAAPRASFRKARQIGFELDLELSSLRHSEPAAIELRYRTGEEEWQRLPLAAVSPLLRRTEQDVPPADVVSIRRAGEEPTYMPIPGGRLEYYDFTGALFARAAKPVVRLADPQANSLLAYLDRGQLDDALLFSADFPDYAERYLFHKGGNPVAAAAGAFVLLRLGALDRLHDWTANLMEWFPWLPDGLVARAEHVARLGDHDAASTHLRRLPERGVPVLSFGLAVATDRLRTYAAAWPEDEALRRARDWCTRYAVASDFSLPLTTYSGRGPDAPEPPSGARHLASL